jgi:hypothetical protein
LALKTRTDRARTAVDGEALVPDSAPKWTGVFVN